VVVGVTASSVAHGTMASPPRRELVHPAAPSAILLISRAYSRRVPTMIA
jgi:hypothetical protein